MIKSFKQKWVAELFHNGEVPAKAPGVPMKQTRYKLAQIHATKGVTELRVPPGNRLEKLKGSRSEEWSIRVNGQWRICFQWQDGDAHHVSVGDYH